MIFKIIDNSNYLEHKDIINYFYNISYDELEKIEEISDYDKSNYFELISYLEKLYYLYSRLLPDWSGASEIWLITGKYAELILKNKPVDGCTFIHERQIVSIITWFTDIDILGRVFLHELCHSYRLKKLNINTYGCYMKYLNDTFNWLYEEMLAISTEKAFNEHLSWEKISSYNYNPVWNYYLKMDIFKKFDKAEDLEAILDAFQWKKESVIYYLAYYLSKTSALNECLNEMMNYESKKGISLVICKIKKI